MGDLQQDADTVAGLPGSVLAGPVLQLLHNLQRVVHRAVIGFAVDADHRADAAGVMLQLGYVQPSFFHKRFTLTFPQLRIRFWSKQRKSRRRFAKPSGYLLELGELYAQIFPRSNRNCAGEKIL